MDIPSKTAECGGTDRAKCIRSEKKGEECKRVEGAIKSASNTAHGSLADFETPPILKRKAFSVVEAGRFSAPLAGH
jgi:hypothetical protein